MKKSIVKTATLVLFISFFILALPSLNFAEKKPVMKSFIFTQSGLMLNLFLPWLILLSNSNSRINTSKNNVPLLSVRPLAEFSIGRPGTGD